MERGANLKYLKKMIDSIGFIIFLYGYRTYFGILLYLQKLTIFLYMYIKIFLEERYLFKIKFSKIQYVSGRVSFQMILCEEINW